MILKLFMDDPETLHGWVKRISIFPTVSLQTQFKHNSQSFYPRKVTEEIVTFKTFKLQGARYAFLDHPYLLYAKVCFNFKIACKENNRSKSWVMIADMDGRVFQDWLWSWTLRTPLVMNTQLQSEPFLIAASTSFLEFTASLWSTSMKSCLRWRL